MSAVSFIWFLAFECIPGEPGGGGLFRCLDHAAASEDPIGRVFDLFRGVGFSASRALKKPASHDVEGVIAAVRQAAAGGCGFSLGGFWVVLHGVSLSTHPPCPQHLPVSSSKMTLPASQSGLYRYSLDNQA